MHYYTWQLLSYLVQAFFTWFEFRALGEDFRLFSQLKWLMSFQYLIFFYFCLDFNFCAITALGIILKLVLSVSPFEESLLFRIYFNFIQWKIVIYINDYFFQLPCPLLDNTKAQKRRCNFLS